MSASKDHDSIQVDWKLDEHNKYNMRPGSLQKRSSKKANSSNPPGVVKVPKKRGPKPRPKPLPMSKYRRKTANLRERERMGEINKAFDHLRTKIPTPLSVGGGSCEASSATDNNKAKCEKMTKINILHVAINYIRALESILETGQAGMHVYGTSIIRSPAEQASDGTMMEAVIESPAKKTKKASAAAKPAVQASSKAIKKAKKPKAPQVVEEELPYCPDWTELVSTLDFSSASSLSSPVSSVSSSDKSSSPCSPADSGWASSSPIRTDLDTLLSSLDCPNPISQLGNGKMVFFPKFSQYQNPPNSGTPDHQLLDQVLKSLPSSTTATKIKPAAKLPELQQQQQLLSPKPDEDVKMLAPDDNCSLTSGLFSRQISFTELLEGSSEQLFSEITDLAVSTPFLDEVFQQQKIKV